MRKLLIGLLIFSSVSALANSEVACAIQERKDGEIITKTSISFFPGKYPAEIFDFKDGVKLFAQELNSDTGSYLLLLELADQKIEISSNSVHNFANIEMKIQERNYIVLCSRN